VRDVGVVIPAGGSGSRLGTRTPKQFLSLGGTPILALTLRHFTRHPGTGQVAVAAPPPLVERTARMLARHARGRRLTVIAGGTERQESVRNALDAIADHARIVLVHDAVRPFIDRALIDAVVAAARDAGAAICALPIAETLKRVRDGLVEETVDRAGLWAVQTPQAFDAALLREAHDKARRDGVTGTDDAMLVERLGHRVRVVPGRPGNVKITTPDDLRRARGILARARRATPR
jgi:2-C-methyl-D-erythritol 4-phosphate cytidylyltransferase